MRRAATIMIIVSALVGAAAAATRTPLVPVYSQHGIKAKSRLLAYVPTSAPTGFRYYKWTATDAPAAMHVWLRNRYSTEISLTATVNRGDCAAGHEKSFQLDGNKVWWSHTTAMQQAWRCVKSPVNGRLIRLTAQTAQPPTKFADTGVGQVAANARWIR